MLLEDTYRKNIMMLCWCRVHRLQFFACEYVYHFFSVGEGNVGQAAYLGGMQCGYSFIASLARKETERSLEKRKKTRKNISKKRK